MNPNFALRRLADRVRPDETETLWVRDHLDSLGQRAIQAFPRARLLPIGSFSRGTAIAVHSNVDVIAVLPRQWATWGARRVAPRMIIERMAQELGDQHCTADIRRDGRAVTLTFAGIIHTIDVMPGFSTQRSNHFSMYSVPGPDLGWADVCPRGQDALFSQANLQSGGKLRAISRLIKTWGVVVAPPGGFSSLYIDMMLATSGIASGVKTYGDCLNEFFNVLLCRDVHDLSDPVGRATIIPPSSSAAARVRLHDSVKAAAAQARAALDAQSRGDYACARRQWKVLFKRRVW
jgi:hypothetical protein